VSGVTVIVPNGTESVPKGGNLQFEATVIGTNNPDPNVRWDITTSGTASGTTITNGLLTVAADEPKTLITVKATSMADPNKSASASVAVTVVGITINPAIATVAPGDTKQFTVVPATATVRWEVSGGVAGTTISNGLLTVAGTETADILTVKATSATDPTNFATAMVALSNVSTVSGVTVTSANRTENVTNETNTVIGWTLQFYARVEGPNNPDPSVTWKVDGASGSQTNIDEQGLLFVGVGETAETLTVIATSATDPTKSGMAIVTVSIKTPTVIFDVNGGDVSSKPPTQTVSVGGFISEPRNPERKYYIFAGWYTKKEPAEQTDLQWDFRNNQVTPDKILGSTFTLYAKWTPEYYTIVYALNGGTQQASTVPTSYTAGNLPIDLPSKPERDNYIFEGWYENSGFSGERVTQITDMKPVISENNRTFYAKWTPSGDNTIAYYWVNEQDAIRLSISEFTMGGTDTLTIAPPPGTTGYTQPKWYVNGVDYTPTAFPNDCSNGLSFTFNGKDKENGKRYTVGLRVQKDDKYYYADIKIKVIKPEEE
jgi:uncharacterized repeat protein (TIGR02543 family)